MAERHVYTSFTFLFQFCLPLGLTSLLYFRIYSRLRRRHPPSSSVDRILTPINPVLQVSIQQQQGALTISPPSLTGSSIIPTSRGGATSFGRTQMPVRSPSITRANKTNRILVGIVVNFIVCWLPWNLFSLVTEFSRTAVSGRHFKLVDLSLKGIS